MNDAIRLVHFSDVHLTARPLGWTWPDWFGKRLSGFYNNHLSARSQRFRQAESLLTVLAADIQARPPDGIVFSGDATTLGFLSETERTAQVLGVARSTVPGIAVPGNHDYYTRAAETSGIFERCFAGWQQGQRLDGAPYPFAQRLGPFWLVGVNSCGGNWIPWDATGRVADDELRRLEQLLPTLADGPRILVTHFPVSDARGRPERSWHRLRNLDQLLAVCDRGGVSLWLHGHRHQGYVVDDRAVAPFPVICAGSATDAHTCCYHEYTIAGRALTGVRRRFHADQRTFAEVERFAVPLRG
ncbi:MAG: metallophosphoesterase [Planctomycetia bacterium]|nr:metallophosphoesterase [Planctomycetia bacterium]